MKLLLIGVILILTACDNKPKTLTCTSSTPKGWVTWEEDGGKTICWKSKGFQCAPKCKEK
jgi:hypothetical protein